MRKQILAVMVGLTVNLGGCSKQSAQNTESTGSKQSIENIENIDDIKHKFKKYYEIFSEDLYKTIYAKYYRGLKREGTANIKQIKKDIKEKIIQMFNKGDFNFDGIDRAYFKMYIQR